MDCIDEKVTRFLTDGYGNGYGYGYGYGYGDGYGNGYGYGNGHGHGDGHGDGYGYGYGYGDGYGNGYGNGDGDGNGYGNGDGNGDDILEFDGHKLHIVDGIPTAIESVHGNFAKGFTIKNNSVKVPCYIARVGNSFAHDETLRQAFDDATAKDLQSKPLADRIADTLKKHPDPTEIIPNRELYALHHALTGSCDFGRRQFCERHGIDLDEAMTMCRFIELTANDYGGEDIRSLAEAYGMTIKTKH